MPFNTASDTLSEEEMLRRYKHAVEGAISHLPAKNGVVDIDSIWVETSIPYELLQQILLRPDLNLPDHVERINTKSRLRPEANRARRKRKRRHKVRN